MAKAKIQHPGWHVAEMEGKDRLDIGVYLDDELITRFDNHDDAEEFVGRRGKPPKMPTARKAEDAGPSPREKALEVELEKLHGQLAEATAGK